MGSIKNKLLILARNSDSYARILRDADIERLEVHAVDTPDEAEMYCEEVNIVLDEATLLNAVRNGQIAGAVLDVFKTEPLPPDHPFWKTKGILITAHTAAIGFPVDIAPVFIENFQRFQSGIPLKYCVDFKKGY